MDDIFTKKIEDLYKKKQFEQIKFEISTLEEKDKKNPLIYNLQGIIETLNKNFDQAKSYFQSALKLDQYHIHSLLNLSRISYMDKDFQNIINLLKNYHEKIPENKEVLINLANSSFVAGFLEDALYFHKKLVDSRKFKIADLAALIALFNYSSNYSEEIYKKYCKLYDDILSNRKINYNINLKNHDKFKIGFLSYDLKEHSVGFFLKDFIKELKKRNFIPIAFNLADTQKNKSNFVSELKQSFIEWHDVINLHDKDLSNFIYEKKLYFLIDLAGYTTNNRLQVFKNKPVPIQISWLGYCNKTYINEIDYMIADPYVLSEKENKTGQKIIRLKKIWNSLSKLNEVEINELPALSNKYFTFGCFNNFLKISDETLDIWSQILNNIPNSRLMLKSSVNADKNYKSYLLKRIKINLNEERIIFLNYEKEKNKSLEQYNKIDVSLDTFPYNGNTTSFESIWMGVPVLTLKGNNFISRCGYSINKNLNLEQLIAKDKKDYIEKAINLASSSNLKNLNTLRNSLRKKAMVSPLFNTSELAENFSKELIKLSNKDHS